jgi:hypothetical protein
MNATAQSLCQKFGLEWVTHLSPGACRLCYFWIPPPLGCDQNPEKIIFALSLGLSTSHFLCSTLHGNCHGRWVKTPAIAYPED